MPLADIFASPSPPRRPSPQRWRALTKNIKKLTRIRVMEIILTSVNLGKPVPDNILDALKDFGHTPEKARVQVLEDLRRARLMEQLSRYGVLDRVAEVLAWCLIVRSLEREGGSRLPAERGGRPTHYPESFAVWFCALALQRATGSLRLPLVAAAIYSTRIFDPSKKLCEPSLRDRDGYVWCRRQPRCQRFPVRCAMATDRTKKQWTALRRLEERRQGREGENTH